MTINLNGKDYNFEFRSQLGILYIYEQLFGTCFQDDVKTLSALTLDIRYSYAVLTLCNKNLNLTLDDFLLYVGEEQLSKCQEYIMEKTKQLYQLGNNDNEVETEEGRTKKD